MGKVDVLTPKRPLMVHLVRPRPLQHRDNGLGRAQKNPTKNFSSTQNTKKMFLGRKFDFFRPDPPPTRTCRALPDPKAPPTVAKMGSNRRVNVKHQQKNPLFSLERPLGTGATPPSSQNYDHCTELGLFGLRGPFFTYYVFKKISLPCQRF